MNVQRDGMGSDMRIAWRKNLEVERTSPGSKNHYKVTYLDGQEKWTDDYPGDGRGGRREKKLLEKKQSRPSIKEARGNLDKAVKGYVDGEIDLAKAIGVVDDVVVHLGREVSRETIRRWVKENKDKVEGKAKEAVDGINKRMIDKLRKKKAMELNKELPMNKIARELVSIASELAGIRVAWLPLSTEKRIRLTPSEIRRADTSYAGQGIVYTIIRRPQPDGKFLIAAVDINSGKIYRSDYAEDKDDVRRAVYEVNRWMDKLGSGGPMSSRSRDREMELYLRNQNA